MPTFYIHVRKSGDELHSVNADSFEEALALYNDGAATLKQDENTEIHNIVVENIETGEKKNEADLLDAPGEPADADPA